MAQDRKQPGELNKMVTIVQSGVGQDAAGGQLADVVVFANVWAAIDSISGQNLYQQTFVAQATHMVTIRYRLGVAANQRVIYAPPGVSRTFNILYIANRHEENVWLDLICEEKQ